jgi:hypothetical protein
MNLNPGVNLPTPEELEQWEPEGADIVGEFRPPDEDDPRE